MMLWYQALIPSVVCALLVRLDAVFLGPYWSWLQLIPELAEQSEHDARRKKNRALLRRVAIPGGVGLLLTSVFSSTYSPVDAAVVGLLTAGLLLWPLVFHQRWEEVRRPRSWVVALYVLLVVAFVASAALGGLIGDVILESGGWAGFAREEGIAILITGGIALFATDGFGRLAEALRRARDGEDGR